MVGIGQATAVSFAKHGIEKLALFDIHEDKLQSTRSLVAGIDSKIEVLLVTVDVSIEDSVVSAIQDIIDRWGRIDIAINNAGFGGPIAPSLELSVQEFSKVLDTNMIGLWVCQREEIRHMLKQDLVEVHSPFVYKRGVIVNVSSTFGLVGPPGSTPAAPYSTRWVCRRLTRIMDLTMCLVNMVF